MGQGNVYKFLVMRVDFKDKFMFPDRAGSPRE